MTYFLYSSDVSVFDFIYHSKENHSSYFVGHTVVHENQLVLVFILKLVIILVLQNCIDDTEKLLVFLLSIVANLSCQDQQSFQYSNLDPVLGRDVLVKEKRYQTCGIVLQLINE